LVTLATLTGHSQWAVGTGHAEVFSKKKEFLSSIIKKNFKIVAVGRYFDDYKECLYKNKILENYNKKHIEAGAAKAFAFLNEFLASKQALTHFDIAGIEAQQYKKYTFGISEISKIVKSLKDNITTGE
jgi:leucyl aminopeptidase